MCGIVGVLSSGSVSQSIYHALTIIQHRGQDAAGIVTSDERGVHTCKGNGLVRDILTPDRMVGLTGSVGVGHVRYPTAGSERADESQPFYVNAPYGLSLVHNGNLTNVAQLRQALQDSNLRYINTQSDSEVLLNVIAYELSQTGRARFQPEHLFAALEQVYSRVEGAYSCLMMINGYGLVAFRDPYGIRPLVYGQSKTDAGVSHMFASESIALDALQYELLCDVAPGEAVFIGLDGQVVRHCCAPARDPAPCIFEYVYLSRPDSILNGISVYSARRLMGCYLGEKILREFPDNDIDVVIPIPDTSRTSALALAQTIGKPYSEGFVKNRYIGRTFIMPGQAMRQQSIRMKLNAINQEFAGKTVLLVDDSIVRGNTSRKIIELARRAGAKKVYFASAAPPVVYPNVYGIDMPVASELIAFEKTIAEIAEQIGVDRLFYQDLEQLKSAVNDARPSGSEPFSRFEDSIFTGNYVSGNIDKQYFDEIATQRSDAAKTNR